MKKCLLMCLAIFLGVNISAQESNWKKQTFITGYVSLESEYVDGVAGDKLDRNFGVGAAEAGVIFTAKPLSKLQVKSTLVYTPNKTFDNALLELSGEWSFTEKLKIAGGRFLSPLSPLNLQLFAPMNRGVVMPMMVSHFTYFPNNHEGLNFNGTIDLGDESFMQYDVVVGGYYHLEHQPQGVLQFRGNEKPYLHAGHGHHEHDHGEAHKHYHLGLGGRVSYSFNDLLSLGVNSFYTKVEADVMDGDNVVEEDADVSKTTLGADWKLNVNAFEYSGGYWMARQSLDDYDRETVKGSSFYSEVSFAIEDLYLTPYAKYEYNGYFKEADDDFSRITAGAAFRPFFQTTLKAEYNRYILNNDDVNYIVASIVFAW